MCLTFIYAFIYLTYKIKNYLSAVKRILQSIVLYTSLISCQGYVVTIQYLLSLFFISLVPRGAINVQGHWTDMYPILRIKEGLKYPIERRTDAKGEPLRL